MKDKNISSTLVNFSMSTPFGEYTQKWSTPFGEFTYCKDKLIGVQCNYNIKQSKQQSKQQIKFK